MALVILKKSKDGKKIPQIGKLIIENEVEIAANTAIDRGALGDTIIGQGTKIDNLVHIAHNLRIGKHCAIAAQVGFAGSVEVGDNVSIAGQAGFNGHIKVGSNTSVLGKAGVTKSTKDGQLLSGFPAVDHRQDIRFQAALRQVPKLLERIKKLEKAKE
ncbi:MAG: hypothetical protein OMM_11171 [Candidatus Magnetoglobus multicellularis str. Araruama]|uniref:UDP-3-O-[3-hydroxymyristoyl] glucosamine N-acyltransferase n=1 Tax=Candidatus Magnetoglobus multicellularis str. Araruama TaxID=890399 RepID=A0A1V1NZ36_9BACT|nr:MAG: hypothetical protein OMM_11171 [Candidatus Magnetoglobus multicellularis str. Araruama]